MRQPKARQPGHSFRQWLRRAIIVGIVRPGELLSRATHLTLDLARKKAENPTLETTEYRKPPQTPNPGPRHLVRRALSQSSFDKSSRMHRIADCQKCFKKTNKPLKRTMLLLMVWRRGLLKSEGTSFLRNGTTARCSSDWYHRNTTLALPR